jgi:large subunit ribosomal protein L14e
VDVVPGQLVKSLQGRDKGNHYLVIGFEGERVLLADGRGRSVDRPKKKNPKHLQPYRCVSDGIKEIIRQGKLSDTELRNILNTFLMGNAVYCPDYLRNPSESGS